jgi:hypothetical protein
MRSISLAVLSATLLCSAASACTGVVLTGGDSAVTGGDKDRRMSCSRPGRLVGVIVL